MKNNAVVKSALHQSLDLDDVLGRHPGIASSFEFNNRLRNLLTPTAACWVEFQLKCASPASAVEFLEKLATGEDLARGNPILTLRNRLGKENLSHLRGRRAVRAKGDAGDDEPKDPTAIQQMALTIIAFNAWSAKRQLPAQGLRWDGVAEAGFPQIDVKAVPAAARAATPPAKQSVRRRKGAAAEPIALHQ